MTIDTKRLASDPGYWDEVAPEGAELFVPGSSFEWRKWLGGIEMFFDYGQWLQAIGPWSLSIWLEEKPGCIPRPTQNPEVEWDGDGPPPVGAEVDYVIGSESYPVTVVGYYDDEVVVFQHESAPDYVGVQPGYLKPQRTKEQRQRDELARLIDDSQMSLGSFYTPEKAAEVIISAGWKKDA